MGFDEVCGFRTFWGLGYRLWVKDFRVEDALEASNSTLTVSDHIRLNLDPTI